MESFDLAENLKKIVAYNFITVVFVFILLLVYGVGKDYVLYGIYNVAVSMESMGAVGSWVASFIESASNYADLLPQILDIFWLALTIALIFELVVASYHAHREGWFSSLGFLTIGILFMLFITSIFITVVDWMQTNLIDTMFGSMSYSIPSITFYLNNALIINAVVIVLCVIANFIDLDFSGFQNRKQRENLEEVV